MSEPRNDVVRVSPSQTVRGFTLIETLVAIGLAALVFAMVLPAISATTDAADLRAFEAKVIDLDRRARVLALNSEDVRLLVRDGEGSRLQLWARDELVASVDAPAPWQLRLEAGETVVDTAAFDRRARSHDYVVVLSSPEAARRISVAGITGRVQTLTSENGP
jgi:prepilin-type N-terminal cleavage/methylation domain-containing protein